MSINRFGRMDNYPDDIRNYDHDPRSPFYVNPDEDPDRDPADEADWIYECHRDRHLDDALAQEEEQYEAEQDRRHDRV